MIEVIVTKVSFNPQQGGYMVILREKDSERWLPILIGPVEAQAIADNLRGGQFQRPRTFDLMASLLRALDGQVRGVQINRLHENTFFAEVVLERPDGERIRVDARPSDAIPLALRLGLAIQVHPDLMEAAGQHGFSQAVTLEEFILKLEGELDEAVEREDFEQAVRLRDQIRYYRKLIQPDEEGESRP
ncbi:MAG: bifunctional nuclease family protein [bacterium]|nr:bifunctional nuclease family protein [bacterium]